VEEENRFRGPDKRRLSVRLTRELDRQGNSSARDFRVLMRCSSGGHLSSSSARYLGQYIEGLESKSLGGCRIDVRLKESGLNRSSWSG